MRDNDNKQYEDFNYEKFCEDYKSNRKVKAFLKYIDEKFEKCDKKEVLATLDENNIIDSLKTYISTGVQYQITAQNYFTYIVKLFDVLSSRFDIKNEIFIDKQRHTHLKERVKDVVSKLKESQIKKIKTRDEYLALMKEVYRVQEHLDRETILEEVLYDETKGKQHYRKLMSVIATKLLLDYGLKNRVLIHLNLTAYNSEKNILKINGVELPLGEEYIEPMKLYLEVRDYILNIPKSKQRNYLYQ